MRIRDGQYKCQQCGAVLAIPVGAVPLVLVKAAGGEPNRRAIVFHGAEIHSCSAPSATVSTRPADI
jgi:hypothetical protein